MKTILFLLSAFCFPLFCSAQGGVSHGHGNLSTLRLFSGGPAGPLLWNGSAVGSAGTVTSVGWTGGIVSVGTATTTPAFTIAGTSGGIPYFSSGTTWATSAALAANSIVIGGGAGVAPSTMTTGTGIIAALGINVGSAGSVVLFNGALGTPSSGTGTNITGIPASGITGTAAILGANTFTAAQTAPQFNCGGTTSSFAGWKQQSGIGTSRLVCTLADGSNLAGCGANGFDIFTNNTTQASGTRSSLWYDAGSGPLLKFSNIGTIGWTSSATDGSGSADLILSREAAATQQQGADTNGDAVDQTIKSADGITGTDKSGADLTVTSGVGTGAGAVSALIFKTPTVLGTGTTAQTNTERVRINSSGITIGSGTAVAKVKHGTAVLVAGTVTVSDSDVEETGSAATSSRIFINRMTDGGTIGDSFTITRTDNTSFVITAKTATITASSDTSTVSWIMVNP